MKEGDDERSRLSRERNDLSRRHQDLVEVVSSLRSELVCNERKMKELDSELLAVSWN